MFSYRKATLEDLEKLWDNDIKENSGDKRYVKWKQEFINANIEGNLTTFVVLKDDEPIGQISLVFNLKNLKAECREMLCNNKNMAHFATFRINKKYEGQGHISKLVKLAEDYAKEHGITYLTIGSEAKESRNLGIYLHFGFTEFITSIVEENNLILFYGKSI